MTHMYSVSYRFENVTKCLMAFSTTHISRMTKEKMAKILGGIYREIPEKFSSIAYSEVK